MKSQRIETGRGILSLALTLDAAKQVLRDNNLQATSLTLLTDISASVVLITRATIPRSNNCIPSGSTGSFSRHDKYVRRRESVID